jgi:hypothetical protein
MTADQPFSDQLESWLGSDEPKTLGALSEVFAEKSFAVAILLLMFLPALPIPTGGVSHVFEAIAVLLAGQMVLGRRTMWVPERWRRRELGPKTLGKAIPFILRRIRSVERFSRPRGAWLFEQGWMLRVLGLLMMALAIAAAIAPPFSGLDTLPALGAVGVALSIILGDVLILLVGTVIGTGGVILMVTIGAALYHLIQRLF